MWLSVRAQLLAACVVSGHFQNAVGVVALLLAGHGSASGHSLLPICLYVRLHPCVQSGELTN